MIKKIFTSKYLVLILILGILIYYFVKYKVSANKSLEQVTVFSKQGVGLSVFKEMYEKIYPQQLNINRAFLADVEEARAYSAILYLSPQEIPIESQLTILQNYVKKGGEIVLSFHDEQSKEVVQEMFHYFSSATDKNELNIFKLNSFENFKTQTVSSHQDLYFFTKNLPYTFYSKEILKENCNEQELECYVKEFQYQSGKVIVIAGLAPFTNALILKNSDFAYHFIQSHPHLFIDEYSHFFSKYTFKDLLQKPFFYLPFFCMLIIILLFFLFSYNSQSLLRRKEKKILYSSFHDFGENYLQFQIEKNNLHTQLAQDHLHYLKSLFPQDKKKWDEIMAKSKASDVTKNFILEHQQLLFKKRGLHS